MKMFRKINIILGILMILLIGISSFPLIWAQETEKEITVIGSALIGKDPDRMYREALTTAFNKAYLTINKENNYSNPNQEIQDPIAIQRKLGISDYKILRYWQTDSIFNMEIKIIFGDAKNDLSQKYLSELPKANWIYQTSNPVISVVSNNLALGVNTARTIDLVDLGTGKPVKKVKTGPDEHDVLNDKYVIKEGVNLKVSNFTKTNFLNLAYHWRRKFPDLKHFSLTEKMIYLIEKNGFLKALHWDDGSIKWQMAAPDLLKIKSIAIDRHLFSFADPKLWMVNTDGQKLWSQELEANLCAEPVVLGNEIYCVLQNATLKILDSTSGFTLGTWNLETHGVPQNAVLGVDEKEVFLIFNDKDLHGHLQTYQRYTGNLQWEASWNGAVTDLVVTDKDLLIIGVGNVLEAREVLFGLKVWDLPVNRKITKLYLTEEKLIVAAENRIYAYDLK